jgi:nitrogen regulatory protein P-II 1
MNYLVVLIVDNIDDCPKILSAWEETGVLGITILESTGLGRMRRAGLSEDLPLMPSLHDLYQFGEVHHRTLFSVVDSQEIVDKMITAAQQVIGDLDDPHTGFLFVVPVSQTHGFGKNRIDRSKE